MDFKISEDIREKIQDIQNKLVCILGKEGLIIEDNFTINQILYRGLEAISKDLEKYEETGIFNTYIFNNEKSCTKCNDDNKEYEKEIITEETLDNLLGFINIKDVEEVFNECLESGDIPDYLSFKDKYYIIGYLESNELNALDNIIKYLWSEFIKEGEMLASTGAVENIDFKYVYDNSTKFLNLIKSLGEFNEDIISKERYYFILNNINSTLQEKDDEEKSAVSPKCNLEEQCSYDIDNEENIYDPNKVIMGFIKIEDLEMLFNSCLKEGLYPNILDLQNTGYSFVGCGLTALQNIQYKISELWHAFIEEIKGFISKNISPESIDFKYVYINSAKFFDVVNSLN